jgi:hypothetical protein
MLIVTPARRTASTPQRSPRSAVSPGMKEVCRTADLEIEWGYVKRVAIVGDDRSTHPNGLGLSGRPVSIREMR